MYFTAYFAEEGTGKTGLSPLLYLYKVSDNSLVVSGEAMTEVARGGYKYNYAGADNTESYMGDADSVTLTGSERYAPINTTSQGEVTDILTDTTAIEIDTTSIEGKVDTINTNVNAIPTTAMRGTDGVSLVVPDVAGTAPTAIEIRQEIDSNSTRLDADMTSRAPSSEYDTEMARITADVATEAKQDIIDTAVDAIPTTAMRGTDGVSLVIPDVAGTATTLHGITDGKIDTVDTVVDAIKAKTDTIVWTDITFIKAIEGGDWEVVDSQMIFYDTDHVTVIKTFDLTYTGIYPSKRVSV